jgi:alpha-tubulin suppressor-like RCC1 family protein
VAYCWGGNANGQLGNSSAISSSTPVAVTSSGALAGKTLTQITTGQAFTCALDSNGAAYCWGANGSGQMGNSTNFQSLVPVAVTASGVLSGKTLTQVTAGAAYVCALDSSGTAYCWGANGNGEVGNNSTVNSTAPAAVTTSGVLSGKTLTQVSAGANFTCALDSASAAYCWGANGNGQLGNNSTTQSIVPVAVPTSGVLSGKTLVQITPDNVFTCALDNAGAAYCWGGGLSGQLGNKSCRWR